ncbi:hypothetical protein AA309_08330 [Microvirga vignae]|uniref:Carrier domain-containing protein n=1 Tax=Microvirga vignae TaxID=1225564 RepID=A0A0H1RE53_9HYPH|nr:acyl carrier protein [Microvirga vignae]KLK93349.1 hypothetical protein AA309_08330 [Microvirga vignae]
MKLFRAVAPVLDVDPSELSVESSQNTIINWDSLAIINLAMALESEFLISLSAEDITRLRSIREIVNILQMRGVRIE